MEIKKEFNTQIASSEWKSEDGSCKMIIETTGAITLNEIYEQWKGLMEAVGFSMKGEK